MTRLIVAIWLALLAGTISAQTLNFPSNAQMTRVITTEIDSYTMPVGPWADGTVQTQTAEGAVTQQAWRITATGLTTLQLIRPLRDQLRNDGFDVIYECRDQACGGFDFRFAMPVLPPPEMQVNLGDFRYLAARKNTDSGPVLINLLASRSARAGYLHVTRVGASPAPVTQTNASPMRAIRGETQRLDLAQSLTQTGHAIVAGLDFQTGSAQLGAGPFEALQLLANFLAAQPTLRVALVGHTDASGSLDGNIALSKRRAGSVLERLVSNYGVARKQLDAQGMGYLAPIGSNLTEQGRTTNRRVEVIITSTD
jgi:OOP family OmpA-OmpF porin